MGRLDDRRYLYRARAEVQTERPENVGEAQLKSKFVVFAACLAALCGLPVDASAAWRTVTVSDLGFAFSSPVEVKVTDSESEPGRIGRTYGPASEDAYDEPNVKVEVTALRDGYSFSVSPEEQFARVLEARSEAASLEVREPEISSYRGYPALRYRAENFAGPTYHYFLVRREDQFIEMWTSDSEVAERFFNSLTFF